MEHYRDDSIHSSAIGLLLSSGEDQHQEPEQIRVGNSGSTGDVVIVVNATDNEEEHEENEKQQHEQLLSDGCQQLVVGIDTDPDYLGDSPKRGYRTDSSGERRAGLAKSQSSNC